jgi:hypothetical protein
MIKKIIIFIVMFLGLWQRANCRSIVLDAPKSESGKMLRQLMKEKSYSELAEFLFIDIPLYFESDNYWRQSTWAKRDGLFRKIYDEVYKNVYKHQEFLLRHAQERERMIDPYVIPVEINEQEIEKIAKKKMGDAMLGYNIQLAEHIIEHADLRPLYPYFERRPDYERFFELKCKNLRWFGETWEFTEALWEARNIPHSPVKRWMAEFVLYDSRFRPFLENLDVGDNDILRDNIQNSLLPLMDLLQKHGGYNDGSLIEALESENSSIKAWAIRYICEHQVRSLYFKLEELFLTALNCANNFCGEDEITLEYFEGCYRFISFEIRDDKRLKHKRNLQLEDIKVIERHKKQ